MRSVIFAAILLTVGGVATTAPAASRTDSIALRGHDGGTAAGGLKDRN